MYFPKDLFKKFEKLRTDKENKLGVTISKNELYEIAELPPEYQAALSQKSDDTLIQTILDELKALRAEVDELKNKDPEKDKEPNFRSDASTGNLT